MANGSSTNTFTQTIVSSDEKLTDSYTGQDWEEITYGFNSISANQAMSFLINNGYGLNVGIADQTAYGVGYTLTTITADVTVSQINGPFFHSSERFYTGTVVGKEGDNQTINVTKDLKGAGLDKITKILGVSFGVGIDSGGFNLSFGFSNSTYTLGGSEEGITWGSSMLNGTLLNGHTTTFTPTPLSGSVVVGAAVLSTLIRFGEYAL